MRFARTSEQPARCLRVTTFLIDRAGALALMLMRYSTDTIAEDKGAKLESRSAVCEQTHRVAEAMGLSARAKAIRDKNAGAAQAQAPSPG